MFEIFCVRGNVFMRRILSTALLFAIVAISAVAVFGNEKRTGRNLGYHVYFIDVEISYGDTLCSIAREYMPNGNTEKEFTDEVMKLNNMKNSKIFAGDNIIIPVYAEINEDINS